MTTPELKLMAWRGGLALLLLLGLPASGIVNPAGMNAGENSDPANPQLDAVGAFSIATWLNGEQQADNWYGAAVLIAPQLIITAKHNLNQAKSPGEIQPGTYAVRFRRQLDRSVRYQSWEAGGQRIFPLQVKVKAWLFPPTMTDLAIGILETPVRHIKPIPVSLALPKVGSKLQLAGWGSYSHSPGQGGPRDGLRDTGRGADGKVLLRVSPETLCWESTWVPKPVMGVTLAADGGPVRIRSTGHGFKSGARVNFQGVVGTVELNNQGYLVTVVDADSFTLDGTDSRKFSAYAAGGFVSSLRRGVNMHDSGGLVLGFNATGQPICLGIITSYSNGTGLNQFQGTEFGARLRGQEITHRLSYLADNGGRIVGLAQQAVIPGENGLTVVAAPAPGYRWAGWSDGSNANPRTDPRVKGNLELTAKFEAGEPARAILTVSVVGLGTTSLALGHHANLTPGTPQPIRAVPGSGYRFVVWTMTDGAKVADPQSATTEVVLTGGYGAVTAIFTSVDEVLPAMSTLKIPGAGEVKPRARGGQKAGDTPLRALPTTP